MAMALKVDVTNACRRDGIGKPVDLVHLSHQTMGDRDLEREVLDIFLVQARACLESWRSKPDPQARMRAAHSLKGAARGIGAWDLAELAARAELPGYRDDNALEREADRVFVYISSLLQA